MGEGKRVRFRISESEFGDRKCDSGCKYTVWDEGFRVQSCKIKAFVLYRFFFFFIIIIINLKVKG